MARRDRARRRRGQARRSTAPSSAAGSRSRTTADGGYEPVVDTAALPGIARGARQEDRPRARQRRVHRRAGGEITGITPSKDGRDARRRGDASAQVQALLADAHRPARTTTRSGADPHRHAAGADHRGGQGRRAADGKRLASGRPTSRSARRTASARTSGSPPLDIDGYVVGAARDVRLLGGHRAGHAASGATATAARSSTAGPSRRARSPAGSARARRRCSTRPCGPASRWAPGATTTTTSTATRSAWTPRSSSARSGSVQTMSLDERHGLPGPDPRLQDQEGQPRAT